MPRAVRVQPHGTAAAPSQRSQTTLLDLLAALRRRWLLALSLGLLLGLPVAAGLWFFSSNAYTARTLLHVDSQQPILIKETPEARVDFAHYQRTQLALVKNRNVLKAALKNPKVQGLDLVQRQLDPVTWLEKQIGADFSVAPEVMRITISGTEPDQLLALLEAVTASYLSEVVEKDLRKKADRLDRLKKLFEESDRTLREKQQALRAVVDDLGSGDAKLLALKQEFALKEVNALQVELLQIQSQLRKAHIDSQVESSAEPAAMPESVFEDYLKKDPDYERAFKHVAQLKNDLAYLKSSTVKPESEPSYERLQHSIETANVALAAVREEVRQRFSKQMREKLQEDRQNIKAAAESRTAYLTRLEETLSKQIEARTKQNQVASKKTNDLEWLKDEVASRDEYVRKINGQIQGLEAEIHPPRRVNPLEDAVIIDNGNQRTRTAAMGFLAVLGLSALGVSFVEMRRRRVHSTAEITKELQLKLLGTLPAASRRCLLARGGIAPLDYHPLDPTLVEAVDATRLVLLHLARTESMQVLLVSSAFGGEGKTMLSSHLAANLASAGHRTLLIGADLRRPAVHALFRKANGPGLSEVLRGEVEVAHAIQPGPVAGLSLLFAGNCKGQPTQLLGQQAVGDLLTKLRSRYDFIIIDSAPILPVPDSQFLAQHVDGVIVSVLTGVSHLPSVQAVCQRLCLLQIRVLGAVVHGAAGDSVYRDYVSDN
jgi:capsular exopolysaccharide synthesis family protein